MSELENGQNSNMDNKISEKAKKALEVQVTKVLRELNMLGELAIKHKSEVNEDVVEVIFEAIKKKTTSVKKQFKNNDDLDEFKL